jgi:hypothetical protein
VWAALQPHHADRFPTPEQVGDLLEEHGTEAIVGMLVILTARLFKLNQPPPELMKGGEVASDPPKAQVGTGSVSS